MAKRNAKIYADKDLINIRKMHKGILSQALNGISVHEVDIDKIYARKLKNINIMEEYFNGYKR